MFSFTSKLCSWIDVANAFNDFFASNFNTNSYDTRIPDDSQSFLFFNNFCGSITDSDILQLILNSTPCTYETNEEFPNGLLRKCSVLFATLFRVVFNCVILNCQFPEIWKSSFIKTIHKGACRSDITNYRPISLLPKISLIFEKLLHNFFIDLLKNKFYPRQYGFQSNKSTICQLLEYVNYLYLNKGDILFSIYFDYEKAFDRVPHSVLIVKLRKIGLDSYIVSFFESYLLGKFQAVRINGFSSMHTRVLSGVPQDSVLGHLLFLIFINDLLFILLGSIMWLFADDAKLVFNSLKLNDDLVRFCIWNQANGMLVNATKSLCISFGTVEPVLEYASITIPQPECVNDLEVYFNRKFKWNTHTHCKVTNSRRAFYKLKKTILWNTPSLIKYKLYVAYVVPILFYGSQICCLSLADLGAFENIQEKCLRWFYGNSRNYLDTFSHIKYYRWTFKSKLRTADCSFSWLKGSY